MAPWGEAKYVIGCLPSSPSSTFMYAGYTQGVSRDEKSIQIVAFIFFFLNPLLGWGQGQSFLRTSKKTVILVNFRSCDETSFVHREIYFSKRLGKKRKGESKKSRDLYFSLFSPDIDKRHLPRNEIQLLSTSDLTHKPIQLLSLPKISGIVERKHNQTPTLRIASDSKMSGERRRIKIPARASINQQFHDCEARRGQGGIDGLENISVPLFGVTHPVYVPGITHVYIGHRYVDQHAAVHNVI